MQQKLMHIAATECLHSFTKVVMINMKYKITNEAKIYHGGYNLLGTSSFNNTFFLYSKHEVHTSYQTKNTQADLHKPYRNR